MIPYGRQSINDADIAAVVAALKSDWLTTGPLVEKFEMALENTVGAPCVVVSSGTAALHCAYAAIGLEPGDEVITPPITFIATQATAALFGAKIVFADVLADTANIDPEAVAALITARTKAIVAVDYAGHPADLDELRLIADKHGIYLIEDAAHSIGSIYKNRPIGSIADITTFSFFPTKNFTTGEGGAVASPHPELLSRARSFARQGLVRNTEEFQIIGEGPWHQEVHRFGLNYRLPDVLCALGLSQLVQLDVFMKRKESIFYKYNQEFEKVDEISIPHKKEFTRVNWHLYPLRVNPNNRLEIFNRFRELGIGVQVNYMPAYWHPVFKEDNYRKNQFINSYNFYMSEISLPMYAGLTEKDHEYTIEKTLQIVNELK